MLAVAAPTTGHAGFDLLVTALGVHLFVDPDAVDALVVYWMSTTTGGVRDATPTTAYGALLRRLALGTRQCELSLFLLPLQPTPTRPMAFEGVLGLFAPADESAGVVEPDAGLSLTLSALAATRPWVAHLLGQLVHPIGGRLAAEGGQHAFRLRNASGLAHDLWLRDFAGDERLSAYIDRPLLVATAAWRIVQLFVSRTGSWAIIARLCHGPQQRPGLAHLFGHLGAELQALAVARDRTEEAVWYRRLGDAFAEHAYQAEELLRVLRDIRDTLAGAARARRVAIQASAHTATGGGIDG